MVFRPNYLNKEIVTDETCIYGSDKAIQIVKSYVNIRTRKVNVQKLKNRRFRSKV